MTGPNVPNQSNFNFPPQGPGGMPPQPPQYNAPQYYPQPNPYGNTPPQHQQYPQHPQHPPHQQYPQQPNQYGNQAPPVHAYLSGNVQYPAGFDPHLVPVWDPGSPDGTTRPVQSKVSAGPPSVYHGVVTNRQRGRFAHEHRQHEKTRAARENYTQRGSEQVFDALPRVGRFLGRVAFQRTTTSPERVQAGYRRKEVGAFLGTAATVGLVALHATGLTALSYAARTGFRFSSNYVARGRTFGDSFRTVIPKQGEAPHQIRGQVAAQSSYNNPFPHLGGNTMPTSPGQARRNRRQAARTQRAQQLQAQANPAQPQQTGQQPPRPRANPNRTQRRAQRARTQALQRRQQRASRTQPQPSGNRQLPPTGNTLNQGAQANTGQTPPRQNTVPNQPHESAPTTNETIRDYRVGFLGRQTVNDHVRRYHANWNHTTNRPLEVSQAEMMMARRIYSSLQASAQRGSSESIPTLDSRAMEGLEITNPDGTRRAMSREDVTTVLLQMDRRDYITPLGNGEYALTERWYDEQYFPRLEGRVRAEEQGNAGTRPSTQPNRTPTATELGEYQRRYQEALTNDTQLPMPPFGLGIRDLIRLQVEYDNQAIRVRQRGGNPPPPPWGYGPVPPPVDL